LLDPDNEAQTCFFLIRESSDFNEFHAFPCETTR
jgi:hypothetical protein